MRLFWAINLPQEIKEDIFALQRRLEESGADAKWVEKENLHLTVQFLGEVEASQFDVLFKAGEQALYGQRPFYISLGGLGAFPNLRRPRVLWLGVQEGTANLQEIHRAVAEAMAALGLGGEERTYAPHLTLARFRSPRGLERLIREVQRLSIAPPVFGPVAVTSVDLMESRLTPHGPIYTLKAKISLGSVFKKADDRDKV